MKDFIIKQWKLTKINSIIAQKIQKYTYKVQEIINIKTKTMHI